MFLAFNVQVSAGFHSRCITINSFMCEPLISQEEGVNVINCIRGKGLNSLFTLTKVLL